VVRDRAGCLSGRRRRSRLQGNRAADGSQVTLSQVAIIDDDLADLSNARSLVERAAIAESVVTFGTAVHALDFLQRPEGHDLDVILLDVDMPDMSGFEFLLAYERLHPSQRARVLVAMLDPRTDARDQSRVIGFGCVRQHLVKPLGIADARSLVGLVATLPVAR
jgi:CheY-like chemotaxis protein